MDMDLKTLRDRLDEALRSDDVEEVSMRLVDAFGHDALMMITTRDPDIWDMIRDALRLDTNGYRAADVIAFFKKVKTRVAEILKGPLPRRL